MQMDLFVHGDGTLVCAGERYRCALGRGGLKSAKREGDGATPVGSFPLRQVFYRPDRLGPPETRLPVSGIGKHDGWCDDPADPGHYNRHVILPLLNGHSAERLWREDAVYDVLVVIGYNDAPPEPGLGSAIFLHVARPAYEATEGCVALALADLLAVLRRLGPESRIVIRP